MIFFAENHNYAIAQAWATGIICFSFAGRHSGMLQAGIQLCCLGFSWMPNQVLHVELAMLVSSRSRAVLGLTLRSK
jgi:hypothetical protein